MAPPVTSRLVRALAVVGDFSAFAGRALVDIVRPPFEGRETLRQLVELGWRSVPLIGASGFAVGIVLSLHTRASLERFGAEALVPAGLGIALIRETGPLTAGLLLAGRMGAGIGAEVAAMKVTEQVDALRLSGVLPVDYLLVPRFLASLVMTIVLSVIGSAIMYGAGAVTAYLSFGVNPRLFVDLGFVEPRHVILGLLKAAAYGAAIPVVAGSCGLRARGSSEGVGWATTAAVVGSSFAVIAIDFALSVGALWLLGGDL